MLPTTILPLDLTTRAARLAEIKTLIASPLGAPVWAEIKAAAARERDEPAWLVDSIFPGRDAYSAQLKGMDYTLCRLVGQRITRHALMFLIDGDRGWIDAALRQIAVLFDDREYPAWNHLARMQVDLAKIKELGGLKPTDAHLRTGLLAKDVGLVLNWLRPHLSATEIDFFVRGLESRALRPFQRAIADQAWWLSVTNNWQTCIVGGVGVAAMALDGLHPDVEKLIAYCDPMMEAHLEDYGPEGEFNEGMGYAGAIGLIVDYYTARLGWDPTLGNRLAAAPFPEMARWSVYMTTPPGHLLNFGDGHFNAPLKVDWMPAIAAAAQDAALQDFAVRFRSIQADPVQLLSLDADLHPTSPAGRWPLGRAYHAHGACISSRTSWDWDQTACVVGSKARREDNHEHNDPGQVVIEGEGQSLIVDWGTPDTTYPAGFFNDNRFRYFDTQAFGHNILVFGGRDMESCYQLNPNYTTGALHGKRAVYRQGSIARAEFDDAWGGLWQIDTAPAWDGVKRNLRTVLHIHPGFVLVFDDAELEKPESISLRWNTARRPALGAHGAFTLALPEVGLAAQVLSLDGQALAHRLGNQGYTAPWNKDQFGGDLPERNCPYVETLLTSDHCRLLTAFAVQPGASLVAWTRDADRLTGRSGDATLELTIGTETVTVHSPAHARTWTL
ncbi:MAG: hypothetical protein ACO3DQ_05505 [Cephaloticoccus sp.]